MLDVGAEFISLHMEALRKVGVCLVQGEVRYPQEVMRVPLLKLFLETRESVHLGQGLAHERLPLFGGIMPVGRNLSLPAWVGAAIGGVDPIRRPGTDDDIVMGMQICRALGASSKVYQRIPLVTNPRREIRIVHGMCKGDGIDARTSYESFHEDSSIYDESKDASLSRCREIADSEINDDLRRLVVRQYYQWVHRSVVKEFIGQVQAYRSFARKFEKHAIGYWELEQEILSTYCSELREYKMDVRQRIIRAHLEQAHELFREFACGIESAMFRWDHGWVPNGVNP